MTVFQFPDYQYLMCFFHIWQILLFSTSHLMTPPHLVLLAAGGLWEKRGVAQSCPTLCDPLDCSLPGSSAHGIFQAWVLEWVLEYWRRKCHFLLQGIFSTQGSNPGLPHCRQMLYHLSHQGSLHNAYVMKPKFKTLDTEAQWCFLVSENIDLLREWCALIPWGPRLEAPRPHSICILNIKLYS